MEKEADTQEMDPQNWQKELTVKWKDMIIHEHFMNSKGRMLRHDEVHVPSLKLPSLPTAVAVPLYEAAGSHRAAIVIEH